MASGVRLRLGGRAPHSSRLTWLILLHTPVICDQTVAVCVDGCDAGCDAWQQRCYSRDHLTKSSTTILFKTGCDVKKKTGWKHHYNAEFTAQNNVVTTFRIVSGTITRHTTICHLECPVLDNRPRQGNHQQPSQTVKTQHHADCTISVNETDPAAPL